ncbi:MAG: hypothetical protein ABW139_19745 [Candidatus Thiodiazotropha sp. DIVDIV]
MTPTPLPWVWWQTRNLNPTGTWIAREFELQGEKAVIYKDGDRLIVEPIRKGRLSALLASLTPWLILPRYR